MGGRRAGVLRRQGVLGCGWQCLRQWAWRQGAGSEGNRLAGSLGVPPAPDVPSRARGQAAGLSPRKNDLLRLRAPSCRQVVPKPGTRSMRLMRCVCHPTGRPQPGTGPTSPGEELARGTSRLPRPAGWTADRGSHSGDSTGSANLRLPSVERTASPWAPLVGVVDRPLGACVLKEEGLMPVTSAP